MRAKSILIGFSCWLMTVVPALANNLDDIQVWVEEDQTRVVLNFSEKPSYSSFVITDTQPYRLVIDLDNTDLALQLPKRVNHSKVVTNIRSSTAITSNGFRLVFELTKELQPEFTLTSTTSNAHQLVVDLPHFVSPALIAQVAETAPPLPSYLNAQPAEAVAVAKPTLVKTEMPFGNKDVTVVIDPGHGGRDPGAIGPSRKYEKHITLAIAEALAELINNQRGMKAILTRTGDYAVHLNKRSEIARQLKADFLISIHADGFSAPEPRGASVWALSKTRANSEIGRFIENHEKQSELLGAGEILKESNNEYLNDALLAMLSHNSNQEGINLAEEVLRELGQVTRLHKSKPQQASLAVLRAPDIPSILVEAGFITNPGEEKQLLNKHYQQKIANAIFLGVRRYAQSSPPPETLFAALKTGVKHRVTQGESLSLIAKRYGISTAQIRRNNQLKSNNVQVGQQLVIFRAGQSTDSLQSDGNKYKVQYGDYLGKIAGKYGVSIDKIRRINRLDSDELEVGQVLVIPGS